MKKPALLLVLTLAFFCLASSAWAETLASGTCGQDVNWIFDDEGTLTIFGSGAMDEYMEQTSENSFRFFTPPWWDLGSGANRSQIKRIIMNEGVANISAGAFRELEGLEEVLIAESVASIGSWAFDSDTALKSVSIPAGVVSIGDRVFYECTALLNISVSASNSAYKSVDGVLFTKDGKRMLTYCPGRTASSYTVPDGVQVIQPSAFSYTAALEEVHLPDSLLEIQNWAFGHTGLKSVVLPRNFETFGHTVFGACSNLTSVSLPASLKNVAGWVFSGCSLSTVEYEGSESQWNSIAFEDNNEDLLNAAIHYNCRIYCEHKKLSWQGAVPHTCTSDGSIAHWACDECGRAFGDAQGTVYIMDVTDPAAHSYESAVTLEPNCAEEGVRTYTCAVCGADTPGHTYTEPIAATHQHHFVDGYCDNILHDGVTVCNVKDEIASGNCGENVQWKLDSSGTLLITGTGPMQNFTAGTVYNHGRPYATYIGYPWRSNADDIKAVIVEEGVTTIGGLTFVNLSSVQTIRLPSSLTVISDSAFSNNSWLSHIYYAGDLSSWKSINSQSTLSYLSDRGVVIHCAVKNQGSCGDHVNWAVSDDGTLTVSGSGPMEENYAPWREWESDGSGGEPQRVIRRVEIKSGVTAIGSGAFMHLHGLKEVLIADSVTRIGTFAFYDDTAITQIDISAHVAEIGERAFYACTSLQNITVNSDNTAYKSMDGVVFTRDGKQLVSYCPGKKASSYTIPNGVKIIWPSAFSYTSALLEVCFPDSLEEIQEWAFGHTGLMSVTLPQHVKTLQSYAFGACDSLKTASFPASIQTMGDSVFYMCPLMDVYYAGTDEEWGKLSITADNNVELFHAELHMGSASESQLHLPAQLTEIRESAFENGTFGRVYLGENVTTIGARAFAGCAGLKYINIPDACVSIAEDAFDGCPNVIIVCRIGSAACKYAVSHGLQYRLIGNDNQ